MSNPNPKSELPNPTSYDHEQDEHDYYYRESEKRLKYFVFSIRAMAILAVIFILILLIGSCSSTIPAATSSTGTVIDVRGDTVWVLFEVVNRKEGDKASNYFHIPGHSYAEGDFYPDPYKDPQLEKLLITRAPR